MPGLAATFTIPIYVFEPAAVRAVDQDATDIFGVPSIVLMENAARGLARQATAMLDDIGRPTGPVLILSGAGNNGGDGYAAARHLHNLGVEIVIAALAPPKDGSDAAINRDICEKLNLPIVSIEDATAEIKNAALIIDALFGTGLDRDVTGEPAHLIAAINEFERPVLAVDCPSGLEMQRGRVLGESIRATTTVTFAGLKPGLLAENAKAYVGSIVVADIGAPIELYEKHGKRYEPNEHHPPIRVLSP